MSTHPSPTPPSFSTAGVFLDALASQDFDQLADALEPDATLSALLPGGLSEWTGAEAIRGAFEGWFGDVDTFEVIDAAIGQVAPLLQLRWRMRLTGTRFDGQSVVVEQYAYAMTGPTGRIDQMNLLCSGFWAETVEA